MKRVLSVILFSLFGLSGLQGQESNMEYSYLSLLEKKNTDVLLQAAQRDSKAWKSFSGSKNWYVEFDEMSGLPHRAFGAPIRLGSSNNAYQIKAFLKEQFSGFDLPMDELVVSVDEGSNRVAFKQFHQGVEVFMASAFVHTNDQNEVSFLGLDLHPQIKLDMQPKISKNDILKYVSKDFNSFDDIRITDELLIVPIPNKSGRRYSYQLAYQAYVIQEDLPAEWYTLVDAHTGEILYRQNAVLNCFVDHEKKHEAAPVQSPEYLSGSLYLTHPFDPISTVGLPYLKVEAGGSTYYSDSAGFIGISSIGTASFPLIGKYVKVLDRSRNDTIPNFVLDLTKTRRALHYTGKDGIDDQHLGAYYHTNIIHDHMSSFLGPVTGLDSAISAVVKRSDGSCNAFYRGTENSINFYTTSNGCNSLAKVADVVYHEYGHAINRNRYGGDGQRMINGGMNEGYADVWAISLTKELKLGVGFSITNRERTVRRYDTLPKVFPQDYVGQNHGDGEIIAGAWVDLAQKIGYDKMMRRFSATFSAKPVPDGPSSSRFIQGRIYRDVLLEALIADDDDANLSNGTPNGRDILDAFAAHGIVLIESFEASHKDLEFFALNKAAKLDLQLKKDSLKNWFSKGLSLSPIINYRDSLGNNYSKILMIEDSKNNYSASLPSRSQHGIVSYFISMEDSSGNVYGTIPDNAASGDPNLPFFILYGYSPWAIEDFEGGMNSLGLWQTSVSDDDATNGNWEITVPIASHYNSDTSLEEIQPGKPFDGTKCAITKNAMSRTASILEASVDSGKTTLRSSIIDLSRSVDPVICYRRWYTNAAGGYTVRDRWLAQIIDGVLPWRDMERSQTEDVSWRRNAIRIRDFKTPNNKIQIQFVASKSGRRSVVEAAVDAIVIYDVSATNIRLNEIPRIAIYPNPSSGELFINLESPSATGDHVTLSDMMGKSVLRIKLPMGITKHKIELGDLPSGVYLARIMSSGFVITKRLVLDK